MRADMIRRWLNSEITITPATGADQYGQPTYGAPVAASARVEHRHARSVTPEGEDFTSTTQAVTLTTVRVGDKITVDGVARVVRATKTAAGLKGGAALVEALL